MPLIECPQCGKPVASVASVCPGCSYSFGYPDVQPQITRNSWWLGFTVVVLLVAALIVIPKAVDDGSRPLPVIPPTPAPPAEVAPPPVATPSATLREGQTKWTNDWANIREGRGLDTPIVQIISPGQQVEVDSLQGRWWMVMVDGAPIGYVHTSLLQDEEPVSEPDSIG